MVAFPAISALISLVCAGVIARDAIVRPRPDKIAWAIAFAVFFAAAACEVLGSVNDWTPALARIYYLTGAVLVVGYLALGELYLLAADRIQRVAPGITLLATAVSATIVLNAGVDDSRLAADGWEAIDRGPALTALAIGINSLGTLVIVAGLIYSAIKFKRLGIQRNRMIGCLLIAIGTIVVGMGGTLTRFGHREYLYIAMAIGSAIIFAGILETRRPDTKPAEPARTPAIQAVASRNGHVNGHRPTGAAAVSPNPAIAFIEDRLALSSDAELSEFCRTWSVNRVEIDAFDRDQARQAWALRRALSVDRQGRFDTLPVAIQRQLTELYHEVLTVLPR